MSQGRKRCRDESDSSDAETEKGEEYTVRKCSPTSSVYTDKMRGFGTWTKNLNNQRLEGQLCDVVLEADEGMKLYAHRCVLAAWSSYFSRMFKQEGFVESNKKEIKLNGVPGEALVRILDFLYTGSLELTTENVHDIMAASDYLLLKATFRFCAEFMSGMLDSAATVKSVLKTWQTADRFDLFSLQERSKDVICKNMKEIILQDDFRQLHLQHLFTILNNCDHSVAEDDIWRGAVNWLEHDLDERKKHLDEVMNCVRFPLMSTDTIIEKAKTHELIRDSKHVNNLIDEAVRYKLFPLKRSKMQSQQTKPRGGILCGVVCIVGTESFYAYVPDTEKWYSLASPLPVEDSNGDVSGLSYHLIFANLDVYAVGKVRSSSETEGDYTVKSLQRYDEFKNVWCEVALPSQLQNTVFVTDRYSSPIYACSETAVEVYSITDQSWKILCEHNFASYEFVISAKDKLTFYNLRSGMTTIVDGAGVVMTKILPNFNCGRVRDVKRVGRGILLLTLTSKFYGYTRNLFNSKDWQFMKLGDHPTAWLNWHAKDFPKCLDTSVFWNVDIECNDDVFVMASHPCITGQDLDGSRTVETVSDGVIPFYRVRNGNWQRLPSIPEQPGKPISMYLIRSKTGQRYACRF